MRSLRTSSEEAAAYRLVELFETSPDSLQSRLANFPKYVRRQDMKRLFVRYELFLRALEVKGSIVECGVHQGFGLMSWLHLSSILEPENLLRRIVGFDTFEGFPSIGDEDAGVDIVREGDLSAGSDLELVDLIGAHDDNRFLGHLEKVRIVKGDAVDTMPQYLSDNPETVVSLLFLDFDLFEPTKVAIETFLPRMPKGAILAFDELDNPRWPGETLAAVEAIGLSALRLRRLPWDPYVSFAVIGD